jgi:RNA polymerase sigma factor (sigma-70 family)
MDYDDVSQILRIHIYKKWHLYDQTKPLAPWLNRIISNQIKNLIRNNYGNYSRPCLKCAASEGGDLCSIYGKQDSSCPLYANWEKGKKIAHNIKIPVPLENHSQEVFNQSEDKIDLENNIIRIHKKMKEILKPIEWKVYKALYVDNKSEEETAKLMGYKTNEENRSPGYKQIKNMKRAIVQKVKLNINNGNIDIY